MLDRFAHSHPALLLTERRLPIQKFTFQDVYRLCNDENLSALPFDLFDMTTDTHAQGAHVELHLERCLREAKLGDVQGLDRLLLEIVLLHRLTGL